MRLESRERFSHHRVTHMLCCMSGSLTSGFRWSRWRRKRPRHSRRMQNLQFYISATRPIGTFRVALSVTDGRRNRQHTWKCIYFWQSSQSYWWVSWRISHMHTFLNLRITVLKIFSHRQLQGHPVSECWQRLFGVYMTISGVLFFY